MVRADLSCGDKGQHDPPSDHRITRRHSTGAEKLAILHKHLLGSWAKSGWDKNLFRKKRLARRLVYEVYRDINNWPVLTRPVTESDMAYGVQAADLCIYCLNWGWRLRDMTEPTRKDI